MHLKTDNWFFSLYDCFTHLALNYFMSSWVMTAFKFWVIFQISPIRISPLILIERSKHCIALYFVHVVFSLGD